MNFFIKENKNVDLIWNQSLKIYNYNKIKRTIKYLILIKKFNEIINYKNIYLLKFFINKFGKIKSRRKTKISLKMQRQLSKEIRKARSLGLIRNKT